MIKCVHIEADNWAVLYGDDEKFEEFHSIELDDIARLLKEWGPIASLEMCSVTADGQSFLDEGNWFPDNLKDLPKEYYE